MTKIHKIIGKEHHIRYLCNQAVTTTKEKTSKNWDKVTCINCLVICKKIKVDEKVKVKKKKGKKAVKIALHTEVICSVCRKHRHYCECQ